MVCFNLCTTSQVKGQNQNLWFQLTTTCPMVKIQLFYHTLFTVGLTQMAPISMVSSFTNFQRRPQFVWCFYSFHNTYIIMPLCSIGTIYLSSSLMIVQFGLFREKNENKGVRIVFPSSDGLLSLYKTSVQDRTISFAFFCIL